MYQNAAMLKPCGSPFQPPYQTRTQLNKQPESRIWRRAAFRDDNKVKGFTLIELLVVVLIIGILSSLALPQYTRAVWKARTAPLRLALAEVKRAEQEYKLANGEMPSSVAAMADFLEMPQRPDGSFGRGNFKVGLSNDSYSVHYLTALFSEGPYAGSGLAYVYYSRALSGITDCVICYENTSKQGAFCEKLFGATHIRNTYGVRFYKLPDSQCN